MPRRLAGLLGRRGFLFSGSDEAGAWASSPDTPRSPARVASIRRSILGMLTNTNITVMASAPATVHHHVGIRGQSEQPQTPPSGHLAQVVGVAADAPIVRRPSQRRDCSGRCGTARSCSSATKARTTAPRVTTTPSPSSHPNRTPSGPRERVQGQTAQVHHDGGEEVDAQEAHRPVRLAEALPERHVAKVLFARALASPGRSCWSDAVRREATRTVTMICRVSIWPQPVHR